MDLVRSKSLSSVERHSSLQVREQQISSESLRELSDSKMLNCPKKLYNPPVSVFIFIRNLPVLFGLPDVLNTGTPNF